MKKACYLIFCIGFGFFCSRAAAQQSMQDSVLYSRSVRNVLNLYKADMQQNLQLFNGSEYTFAGHGAIGFPFFESAALLPGTIYYNGKPYYDVSMQYDLVTGNIVINDYTKSFSITPVREKIDSFFILRHKFIHLYVDPANAAVPGSGFYEVLYEGKITVLAKREKKYQLSLNAADKTAAYPQYDTYYVQNNAQFYQVHNKSAMLESLPGKKNLIKDYISKNKLDFKRNRERAIVQTAEYYDQINN